MSTGLPSEVRLANDIARAFSHLPPEASAHEIATHIRQFWDPRMRQKLNERVNSGDPNLDPLVLRALDSSAA